MKCPKCDKEAIRTKTKYGIRNKCCGLWSWGQGPLVDGETHEARKAAHGAFDVLWKDGHISRKKAYRKLGKILKMTPEECHMKLMDAKTAKKVPMAVLRIKRNLDKLKDI
jgi:hypothetical protein